MEVTRQGAYWQGRFTAMASPCEILLETDHETEARLLGDAAETEARRIETKFSRYRDDNIVHAVNNSAGSAVTVDDETAGPAGFRPPLPRDQRGALRCHQRRAAPDLEVRRLGQGALAQAGQGSVAADRLAEDHLAAPGTHRSARYGNRSRRPGQGVRGGQGGHSCWPSGPSRAVLVNFGGDLRAVGRRADGATLAGGRGAAGH